MKKRVSFFLLVLLLVIPVLTVAGGGQGESPFSRNPADVVGRVEIIVPSGGFYVETLTTHFIPLVERTYPRVEVVVSTESSEGTSGTEALNARLAAGDIPDLYIGPRGAVAAGFAREGQLVALDMLAGYDTIEKKILPQLIDRSLGNIFYFPYEAITTLMLYNKELFAEAGLDPESPPETWDAFLRYAEKIDNLPERSWGSQVYGATTWTEALSWGSWYWNMLAPLYANFNDGKAQLFNEFGTDIVFDQSEYRMEEFFTYMKRLHAYAPGSMDNKIWGREIGMWPQFGVGWRANLDQGRDVPMVLGQDVAVAPIPVLEKGMTHWTTHGGRGIVMFKTNPEREALAFEILKLMFNEAFYLEYCKELSVLPVISTVADDAFFQGPEIQPFVAALENVVEEESFPAWDAVANIVLSTLAKVMVTEELSPAEGVELAAKEARAAIQN